MINFPLLGVEEAEVLNSRYWSGRDARLAKFSRLSGGAAATGTRQSLGDAMSWTIAWFDAQVGSEDGGDVPVWAAPTFTKVYSAPQLCVIDALGYLWAEYVLQQAPSVTPKRCEARTVSFNEPVLWADEHRYMCPFGVALTVVSRMKDDEPARGTHPAGRDPEALALRADNWVEWIRKVGAIS